MRVKQGFMLQEIADEYFAIPYDAAYEAQDAMMSLNRTGAFLWSLLEEETTSSALVDTMAEEYQIPHTTAEEAVDGFLSSLRDHDLLLEDENV